MDRAECCVVTDDEAGFDEEEECQGPQEKGRLHCM